MATPKTWEAVDITKGRMSLKQVGVNIEYAFRYQFVDASDAVITDLPTKTLSDKIAVSAIPDTVLAALVTIRDYFYNSALVSEGMD